MSHGVCPRVVVTGLGVVSAWGWGVDSFWRGAMSGAHALHQFQRFENDDYPTHIAGEVPPPPESLPARIRSRARLSFADQFALASAREAVSRAGLGMNLSDADAGVFFGSSTGGMFESEVFYRALQDKPAERIPLSTMASQQISGPGEAVARELRVSGPVETVSSACSSATLAIGAALDALRDGSVRVAVVGGSDSLCRTTYGGFNALRAVDERPCLPFRADRAGLSLGEGGAVLVLETANEALARGASPLAELTGAGASADAHHMTAPDPSGRYLALAVRRALDDAGIEPRDVDFVNAHGTGTGLNDLAEYQALEEVFGSRAKEVPVTATKGSVGHLLGSAGAIEAVATVLCLYHQRIHPTPGAGEVEARTPVNLVRDLAETTDRLEVAVSLNLAFGGCNAALVLSRWEGM